MNTTVSINHSARQSYPNKPDATYKISHNIRDILPKLAES